MNSAADVPAPTGFLRVTEALDQLEAEMHRGASPGEPVLKANVELGVSTGSVEQRAAAAAVLRGAVAAGELQLFAQPRSGEAPEVLPPEILTLRPWGRYGIPYTLHLPVSSRALRWYEAQGWPMRRLDRDVGLQGASVLVQRDAFQAWLKLRQRRQPDLFPPLAGRRQTQREKVEDVLTDMVGQGVDVAHMPLGALANQVNRDPRLGKAEATEKVVAKALNNLHRATGNPAFRRRQRRSASKQEGGLPSE